MPTKKQLQEELEWFKDECKNYKEENAYLNHRIKKLEKILESYGIDPNEESGKEETDEYEECEDDEDESSGLKTYSP